MGQKRFSCSEDGGSKHTAELEFTQHTANITNEAVRQALSKCFIHGLCPSQAVVSVSSLAQYLMEIGSCVYTLFLIRNLSRVLKPRHQSAPYRDFGSLPRNERTSLLWIVVLETEVSCLSAHTGSAELDFEELVRPYSRLLCVSIIRR